MVPIDAYVFNGPTEFLGLCHQDEIMIGVIGMLDAIDEEKDVVVDGKVVTMISLDLDHDGLVWFLDKKQVIHTFLMLFSMPQIICFLFLQH